MMEGMSIKQFSQLTGITADTLRYYEKIGLLPPVPRTESGIRSYDANSLAWVQLIQQLKASGLMLEEIQEYIRLARAGSATLEKRKSLLFHSRQTLQQKLLHMQGLLSKANDLLANYEMVLVPQTNQLVQRAG